MASKPPKLSTLRFRILKYSTEKMYSKLNPSKIYMKRKRSLNREAKHYDKLQGIVQDLVGMDAASDVDDLDIEMDEDILDRENETPTLDSLKRITGKIYQSALRMSVFGAPLGLGLLMRKKLKFREWLKANGHLIKNKDMKWPQFYTNSNTPFATNPWFVPKKPISSSTQNEIYQTYQQNPTKWTPRALAVHYSISIPRITAILKTGALAQKMIKENKPLQLDLARGMDKMLGAIDINSKTQKYEPVRSHYGGSLIPYFQFGHDLQSLSPKDAAKFLLKDPWSNIDKRLNVEAEKVFSDEVKGEELKSKIIVESEKIHAGKCDFMFVDTSKNQILVRDKSGALREASKVETLYKKAAPLEKYVLE